MLSQEEKLAWFGDLLDKIGPGVRLEVDDVVLTSVFESDLREALTRASAFAEEHHCGCIYHDEETSALFVRAYFKKHST